MIAFTLDRPALAADIRGLAREIVLLKQQLRCRWLRPMAEEQRRLACLKLRATELCALSAYARGRRHLLRVPDPDSYHRRIAERLGPSYARLLLEQSA
jgi:hypothetical protein